MGKLARVVGLLFLSLFGLSASAQTLGYDHYGNLVGSANTTQMSVEAATSGAANIKGDTSFSKLINGRTINVPVTARVSIGKAALAKAGGAIAGGCGPLYITCAITAAQIAKELLNQPTGAGIYRTCPNGVQAWMCVEATATPNGTAFGSYSGVPYWWGGANLVIARTKFVPGEKALGQKLCDAMLAQYSTITCSPDADASNGTANVTWSGGSVSQATVVQYSCGSGYILAGATCTEPSPTGGTTPVTAEQVEPSLQQKLDADFDASRRLVEAMRKDQAAATAANQTVPDAMNPVKADTPVAVSAPPVSSAQEVTSTTTRQLANGSTDTIVRQEQTTVTPTTTGSTVGSAKTTFPSNTVSTSSTTNSVTNVTTTNVTTTNNPAPAATAAATGDIPTDYNREVTQQKIANELDTSGVTMPPNDHSAVEKAKRDDVDQKLDDKFKELPGQIATDKSNWFSWVWTPPVGSCAPFAGDVHGFAISWDLCPTINNIRDTLGWLFALFAAIQIYGLIFKE